MKNLKSTLKDTHFLTKFIVKFGTIIATLLLICAFFVDSLASDMCVISVYLFSESIILGLLIDVIDKRR